MEAACEPAVGVVCGTEEAVWKKNPALLCGFMDGLWSRCHASQDVKVCHLATVELEGHSLMSLLWDCTFSFDKKSLMWIADVSLTDWGSVCRLVL